ncbi:MAG: 2-isopropylmalate synthase [Spirochaetes bacterium]|nr:2-isopropylmalate synthase [Spirochaetota bacterium]
MQEDIKKDKNNKVTIFDTTLRDGEQSPGFSMNMEEKLHFTNQLVKLGVDVIEAGFPIASPGDFEAVQKIAEASKGVTVAGLARADSQDIDVAWDAIKNAEKPRIHTFISSSDIHIDYQLKKNRTQVLEEAIAAVQRSKSYTWDVEFSPMDASRSDRKYLAEMVEAVIDAGAMTVNIPDTVGYAIPSEFGDLIKYLFDNVKNINKTVISVHCHNDLGFATANAIAAIEAGARQVECTINGIGERAGNTSLEEVVMAIRTRSDILNVYTDVNTKQIMATSKLLTHITGVAVQPNKAIVGANAFAHESGIHQDGVLKDACTYEIMKPEDIGIAKSTLVLGKHSGRHAVSDRMKNLGYEMSKEELDKFFVKFKDLADKKKEVFDDDLETLVWGSVYKEEGRFTVNNIQISTGMHSPPMTMVTLRDRLSESEETFDVANGNGGVDAGVKAVKKITGTSAEIESFKLVAITGGSDALCEVTVSVVEKVDGKQLTVFGNGVNIDISVAGILSFVDALNRLEYLKKKNGAERSAV